ncbi:MAG: ChaN family lipoprotein [Rhodocyclaceae bacterium]|nr:ChaN family lipoprotein [Rhodocyclaceae bacterium]
MRLRILAMLASLISTSAVAAPATACGQPGQWLVPAAAQAEPIRQASLLARMARQQVVLLGEAHDSAEDHRWQLHTLTQLHAQQPQMAIGFEMFPRRVQPALDQWVAGALSEDEFLQRAEWEKVWGFDAQLYLPLFHFARMNRIPMLALNVERSLIEAVGKQGWEAVPEAQKEGVSRPAAPTAAYREELRAVFDHHPAKDRGEAAFPRFVEAQTLWDRAMAQVMAEHLQKTSGALVVGIMGAGHVRNGHGVAHQLKDLGIGQVGTLLTWDRAESCANLGKGFADALYLVEQPKTNPPRLGVATEQDKDGLRITSVTAGSIAESSGLKSGDVIFEVAGQPAKSIMTLRAAVQRQAPGTWLPLKIRRGSSELEIVARFPAGS